MKLGVYSWGDSIATLTGQSFQIKVMLEFKLDLGLRDLGVCGFRGLGIRVDGLGSLDV